MGKGQRNKQKSTATFAAASEAKKTSTKKIISIVAAILVVAIIGGLIGYSIYVNNGGYLRATVAAKSEHYTVNNAMMSYFFYSTYSSQLNENGYIYTYYYGLDTSKSLKAQNFSEDQTWFDYFMSSTRSSVKRMLVLCEAALAANVNLDKEDNAQIDELISQIKQAAKASGRGESYYLQASFGYGVKLSDIRDALKINKLAAKYYNMLIDSYKFTDDEIDAFYAENKKDYNYVDYLKYAFTYVPTSETTEETTETDDKKEYTEDETQYANIKQYADELALCLTEEDFKAYVKSYIENDYTAKGYKILEEGDTASTEKDALEVKRSDIDTKVSGVVNTQKSYSSADELSWMFEDGVNAQEVKQFNTFDKNTNTYTTTVVVCLKPAYRLDYNLVNVRHILFGVDTYGSYETSAQAKAAAEHAKAEYEAGAKTAESFNALAEQYNDDSGSLYEGVSKGEMVTSFNDWIFDESRKPGDYGIIETEYGWHFMYFDSMGEAAWISDVRDDMMSDKYDSEYKAFEEAHEVNVDKDACDVISA